MRFFAIFAALAAIGLMPEMGRAQPAASASSDEAQNHTTEHRGAAMKLASLVYSDNRQLEAANGPVLEQMEAFFRADPAFADLEALSPGLIDDVMSGVRPLLIDFTRKEAPRYRSGVSLVYAQHMTTEELEQAAEFYASPLGQKLLDKISENMSFASMFEELGKDIDGPTSERAVSADIDRTSMRAVSSLSKAELEEIAKMEGEGWILALNKAQPELLMFETSFANEPAPEFEARIEKVVTEIIERRLEPLEN